jgi:hypothetical protein
VKWRAWYRFTHAASCAQKEQFMTTTNSTSWKHWSTTTKFSVGLGAIAAACVLVFLYTT